MPESNGSSRLDRIEGQFEKLRKRTSGLLTQAEASEHAIRAMSEASGACNLNASVKSLVGAIRDLIDRIPPENLR